MPILATVLIPDEEGAGVGAEVEVDAGPVGRDADAGAAVEGAIEPVGVGDDAPEVFATLTRCEAWTIWDRISVSVLSHATGTPSCQM